VEALSRHKTEKGFSQASIAKAVNLSDAVISAFLGLTYKGDVEAVKVKIVEYLNMVDDREQSKKAEIPFTQTSQAQNAMTVIKYCQVHRAMGVIHGPAGLGKTKSLEEYSRINSQTRLITAFPGMSQRDLMDEILDVLRKQVKGGKGKMHRAIIEELEGSEILLLFDEAQHFTLKVFETIRSIHDLTRVGMVFAGNDDVIGRMLGRKNISYDQLFSRVGIRRKLGRNVLRSDVEEFLKSSHLSYTRNILLFLFRKAQDKGHFRTMIKCLEMGQEIARVERRTFTVDDLAKADKVLLGVSG
jgi:DNA transposition AAA+ family ATPase